MQANLDLLRARTRARLSVLSEHIEELPDGRGGELKALLRHVHGEFMRDAEGADADLDRASSFDTEPARLMRLNVTQRLERIQPSLDVLHFEMATYRDAVARSDVPVGLQHLIDVLMEQIVIDKGDPIIHLDARNMYSTIDLVDPLNDLVAALGPTANSYSGRHPIVFNLPALDPNNVLLAPVLAHEVAHTAVTQALYDSLQNKVNGGPLSTEIDGQLARLGFASDPDAFSRLAKIFQAWSAELLCDAVAIALSGPSFLLAFTAFVPPTGTTAAGPSHPDIQDRIGFALDLTDQLGWASFMAERAPKIVSWLREVATHPVLTGGPEEEFLRWAMTATHQYRCEVALEHIKTHFVPGTEATRLDQAADWLAQGVPMIDIDELALSPWQTILAGWLAAIRVRGDESSTIAVAAGDRSYNAVIVKALEYSQIVSTWREA